MFVDEVLDSVEFKSKWKKERYIQDTGCQTLDLEVKEVASQSTRRKHKEVQTDEDIEDHSLMEDDSQKLQEFVMKMEILFQTETRKTLRSHAFDGYEVKWDEETADVSNVHTLAYTIPGEQLQVTGLSWNCTGAVIAASYGRFDHEDWCTHKSALCTWNLDRRNLDPNKPDMVLDMPTCLMCIACHPRDPSWIAGGTFNGEILVWDLSREDDTLVASSGIGDDSHREPVSKVQWIAESDGTKQKYNVLSVSGDGKILIWKVHKHKKVLKLNDGFILLTEALPRSMRMRAKRGDQEMGVTCVSASSADSTTFLIGSESGGIFRCSTNTRGTAANSSVISSVPLASPVTFTFSPHHGPVYGVECAPHHRNLFLTCGTDTSLRIYSMLQVEPLITVEPNAGYLYSAKWSPSRPLVFAAATESGHLLIYDIQHNRGSPKYKLEGNSSGLPLFTLQFNHKQSLLATGDSEGNVVIWKMSDELTNASSRENDILEEIANSALE